ncbi:tetratricopeptide repeat protein [Atopococcus tabaci]|uniref:tetratricopeptide repeat protein n=1 Tax=Atopococcus tabaci TaxID=269774 RepID=UPI0003F549BC|nr:tetratricopeptide repeat protein [Atopococcus tabaci]
MSNSQRMIEAIQQEKMNEAYEYFHEAMRKDSSEELYLLADSLYQLGFLEETQTLLLHLLELHPGDDELRVNLAEIAIEDGDDDRAFDWLFQIKESSAAYPQALLVLADLYQVQGLHEVSEQKLLEARELTDSDPVVQFALAELYFSVGRYLEAVHIYEGLLEEGHETFVGIRLDGRIGSAYSALGKWDEAVSYLEKSTAEEETVDKVFQLGFTYFQKKDYSRAVDRFSKVKELDYSYTSVYPFLAEALEETGDLEKAAETIEEGLTVDQTNPRLFVIGAHIAIKKTDLERAEEYFKEAISMAPSNETYKLDYVNFLLQQERFEEAVDIIQQSLTQQDADPQFYWSLASAQEGLEEYEAADRAYAKAFPYFQENPSFLKQYIFFLREEGNWTQMKELIPKYLTLVPDDIEIIQIRDELNELG